jgi:hypothetical protein
MSYPQGCSDRGLGPGRKAIGNGGALKGFALYMVKAVLGGRAEDFIDLARANLWV